MTGKGRVSAGSPLEVRHTGFRPPQQARSRVALEKLLSAAEEALSDNGLDQFTIAAVAERSGLSVGAIYRRFDGKEELIAAVKNSLLTRVEAYVAEQLSNSDCGLAEVLGVFVHSLAEAFAAESTVLPDLLVRGNAECHERGFQALATVQRLLLNAAAPYFHEINRPDPMTSIVIVARTLIGSCIHRTMVQQKWPDGLTWQAWADVQADIATTYLLSSG